MTKKGHIKYIICELFKEDMKMMIEKKGNSSQTPEKVATTVEEDEDDLSLMVQESKDVSDSRVLDSGCSRHICAEKKMFTTYQEVVNKVVTLPNHEKTKVEGVGEVKLKLHNDQVKDLTNIRNVLKLKRNIISVGSLDKKGYTI